MTTATFKKNILVTKIIEELNPLAGKFAYDLPTIENITVACNDILERAKEVKQATPDSRSVDELIAALGDTLDYLVKAAAAHEELSEVAEEEQEYLRSQIEEFTDDAETAFMTAQRLAGKIHQEYLTQTRAMVI